MTRAEHDRNLAIGIASEMMGELVAFWGFKASMGRIWTLLYLSSRPLSADVIAERTGLSAGAVSMSLTELMQWRLVDREPMPGSRKRFYRAETDIWAIIRRIFKERELRLVQRAVEQFARAVELLEQARQADPEDPETAFVLERLQGLLLVARTGYGMVEKLAELGRLSLDPLRGVLASVRGVP